MSLLTEELVRQQPVDIGSTLGCFRYGRRDPTTTLIRSTGAERGVFFRATLTPDGPGTLRIAWSGRFRLSPDLTGVDADAWGPGAEWLLERVRAMLGASDRGSAHLMSAPDPAVANAAGDLRAHRLAASHDLYHELVPTVIEQRITSGEAKRQWRQLCEALSEPAPGDVPGLLLPPAPEILARQPSWWFHPLGMERKRAETIQQVARHAAKYWGWSALPPRVVDERLRLIPGVGPWTVGSALAPALGDADAVPVGDYHLKNVVAWALTGEPRGTDENMLRLLEPYAGDRGRVVRLLKMSVGRAPKFGPKKRVLPMHRW
jgi:3-methyladenine DNA glycosylase/8-oxoguanine DNA glycosylase